MPDGADRGQTHPVPPLSDDPGLYGRSFASVYDDWYGDEEHSTLIAAVLDELADGGDVLELGVGTGAVARLLHTSGVVVGLDASPEMLETLDALDGRDVMTVVGDMADARSALEIAGLDRKFRIVFCSHNTFLNLTTIDAQRACIESVVSSLTPDGVFVIESIVPAPIESLSDHSVSPARVPSDGVVFIQTRLDRSSGVIEGEHVEIAHSNVSTRAWRVLPIDPDALDALAADAGLRLDQQWADWHRTPFTDGDLRIALYRLDPTHRRDHR